MGIEIRIGIRTGISIIIIGSQILISIIISIKESSCNDNTRRRTGATGVPPGVGIVTGLMCGGGGSLGGVGANRGTGGFLPAPPAPTPTPAPFRAPSAPLPCTGGLRAEADPGKATGGALTRLWGRCSGASTKVCGGSKVCGACRCWARGMLASLSCTAMWLPASVWLRCAGVAGSTSNPPCIPSPAPPSKTPLATPPPAPPWSWLCRWR